jgi:hypothetical protein
MEGPTGTTQRAPVWGASPTPHGALRLELQGPTLSSEAALPAAGPRTSLAGWPTTHEASGTSGGDGQRRSSAPTARHCGVRPHRGVGVGHWYACDDNRDLNTHSLPSPSPLCRPHARAAPHLRLIWNPYWTLHDSPGAEPASPPAPNPRVARDYYWLGGWGVLVTVTFAGTFPELHYSQS